jgi:hypothetical protein
MMISAFGSRLSSSRLRADLAARALAQSFSPSQIAEPVSMPRTTGGSPASAARRASALTAWTAASTWP